MCLILTVLLQQIKFMEEVYPSFQDHFLQVRALQKGDTAFSQDLCDEWVENLMEMDTAFREKLFILVIAAEEGWQIASEVAFRKTGTLADKDLYKVKEKAEKRKRDGPKEAKSRKAHRPFRKFFPQAAMQRQDQVAQAPSYLSQGIAPPLPAYPPPPPGGYGQRPETRTCLICKQTGHLYRFCPNKSSAAAALGQAPK